MVMASMLKQAGRDEQGQMLTLVGVLMVFMLVVSLLGNFFNLVKFTFGMQ